MFDLAFFGHTPFLIAASVVALIQPLRKIDSHVLFKKKRFQQNSQVFYRLSRQLNDPKCPYSMWPVVKYQLVDFQEQQAQGTQSPSTTWMACTLGFRVISDDHQYWNESTKTKDYPNVFICRSVESAFFLPATHNGETHFRSTWHVKFNTQLGKNIFVWTRVITALAFDSCDKLNTRQKKFSPSCVNNYCLTFRMEYFSLTEQMHNSIVCTRPSTLQLLVLYF